MYLTRKEYAQLAMDMLKEIKPLQTISDKELSKHNNEYGMWVAIYGKVFDLTEFYMNHPGGYDIIEQFGGKDATRAFEEGEHTKESVRDLVKYYVGEYDQKKPNLAEMKSKAAKDQIDQLKRERNLDHGRQCLGLFVVTLLVIMISYFIWSTYHAMKDINQGIAKTTDM